MHDKEPKNLNTEATMSLGDHLEELRFRLVRALLAVAIGLVICLSFGKAIIGFIQRPYEEAMNAIKEDEAKKGNQAVGFQMLGVLDSLDPTDVNQSNETKSIEYQGLPLPVFTLEELAASAGSEPNDTRSVAIIQVGNRLFGLLCAIPTESVQELEDDVLKELRTAMGTPAEAGSTSPFIVLSPAHGIVSYIKISLISGLIISSPIVFYQIWMFVAAGLYRHEKQFVYQAAPFSAGLFIAGALFFMFVVAPLTLKFLVLFNRHFLHVQSTFAFADYVSFVTMLTFVFGVAFQSPIAIFFLTKTGLVSIARLRASRGYVLLGIVIVAAMATPPDVISQVFLAGPLYLLFELGIVMSAISEKRANKNTLERKQD